MLVRLRVQNFALIQQIELEFCPRLNVLTGETGAGKSILIDALRFVLGDRVENDRLGPDSEPVLVEAVFEISDPQTRKHPALEAYMEDGEEILVLRRERTRDGRSRCTLNEKTVPQAVLRSAGARLVDIHGQYDHQLLFDAATHLEVVDRLARVQDLKEEYGELFTAYELLRQKKEELAALEQGRERETDLLKYQIDEIERAGLEDTNEEEAIKGEQVRMGNSEKLHETVSRLLGILNDQDASVSEQMSAAARDAAALARLDPQSEAVKNDFDNLQYGLEDLIRRLDDYRDGLSFDPARLAEIEKRLDQIDLLKRKYGGSIEKILEFAAQARTRYDQLVNYEVHTREAAQKMKNLLPALEASAAKLTDKRKRAALNLKRSIEQELADLEILKARFECQVAAGDFAAEGRDRLEFMISLNAGEALLPLRKIISGGEASRVMLALKKVLMKADPVPVLIFDEIDANIGGRLGTVTGRKLKEISAERQVFMITHLPQIASFADRHFKVEKTARAGKTGTSYRVLEGGERVKELAQMMSGKRETEISLKHAEEMLSRASQ